MDFAKVRFYQQNISLWSVKGAWALRNCRGNVSDTHSLLLLSLCAVVTYADLAASAAR